MARRARPSWMENYSILLECQNRGICGGIRKIKTTQEWVVTNLKLKIRPLTKISCEYFLTKIKSKITSMQTVTDAKIWCSRNQTFDKELKYWVLRVWNRGAYLMNGVILEQANQLLTSMNMYVAKDCQTVLELINLWLYFFKNGIDLSALSHMVRK